MRIVPPNNFVTVEEVLLAAGEQVGHDNVSFASRMNKAVVVFLKDEPHVYQLIEKCPYQGRLCAGIPAVTSFHADHRLRCSAVYT